MVPKRMNFRKGSKRPLTPNPRPLEWSLSLEIVCMHFILSGPHTSLHISIAYYATLFTLNRQELEADVW